MPGVRLTTVYAEIPREMDDRFTFAAFLLLGYYAVNSQATVRLKGIWDLVTNNKSKSCLILF